MLFQLAITILAGCAVQVVADAPVSSVDPDAPSSRLEERDLHAAPANANDSGGKKHRLLQRFKKRGQRARSAKVDGDVDADADADVGVLASEADAPRFLQSDYDYYCPRQTCPTDLCDCAEDGGSLEDCTHELQGVCGSGRLGDCVFEGYVEVYKEVYCPFVACTEEGFRAAQCDCAFYDLYCTRLKGDECSSVLLGSSDETDKKPFFGCDETELKDVCDQAHTCKGRGDLQGLPDLGTWKGTVMTLSGGERVGRGGMAAGVALLSMLWLMAI